MTTNPGKFNSYPPFFRPNQTVDHVEHGSKSESDSCSDLNSDSVPVIDFQLMKPENLSKICKEWGMFRLVNHGIPVDLLRQLHAYANKLFSLDFESKQALLTSPMLYFWGSPALTMSGKVQQTGPCSQNFNWLEGLNVPLSKMTQLEYQDPVLESFRSLLEEYGNHQTRLAKAIFTTMAQDLNFPPPKAASYLSPPTGILRVYRYLQCPMAEQRWGINAHTDSSVLSIIYQDQVGGLQVYKNDKWLDVKPIQDTLIVNLGDMMQAISNDKYVSVKHRVKVNKNKERISMGYFVFPHENAVIESSKYKPFTYADFRAEKELDLKNVGIKIGLPRFRITEENEL
ncbi:Iron/ascorbate family oxidoreductase [Handroanthus impetiginosus]|uniref:Iron/ascorbate family oxidoreductase n=1 Tax=Handroanthus impetiginosus TaxID=429701 RepID=A0A2G9H5R0_9LAMI|nr:Iron/ascorbate family oxidoreductase [Handroanthus impetiginosus]